MTKNMRVSDYVSYILSVNDITNLFTIPGGFAMHLNDSFGKNDKFETIY